MQVARGGRSVRHVAGLFMASLCAGAAVVLPGSAGAAPGELWVNQAKATCSDRLTRDEVDQATPWCTLQAAARGARAGDTVQVMPGRYRGTVRPAASGSASAPIRFLAPSGGVTIDAAGAAVGLQVVGVSWLSFQGFTITGAAAQGVYVDRSSDVTFAQLQANGNGTYGFDPNIGGINWGQHLRVVEP